MSFRIDQGIDGTWSLVNKTTGNTAISVAVDDTLTLATGGTLSMTRAALAATGSSAATAAVIATQVVAVTASDGTKAVALPAAATTTGPILVINTVTTATLPVYPINGGNDNINAGAEDAAFTLGAGKAAWFVPTSTTQWYCADVSAVTATTTELNYVDVTTAGTVQASKAVVVDSNKDATGFRNVTLTNVDAGASGTAGTVDVFPTTASKGKLIIAAVDNDGDTNVTLSNAAMGQASVISFPDPGASTANVVLTSAANDGAVVTATSAELNYNDITTLGTGAASKAVVLDAGEDYTWPDTGVLTIGVLATASEAAEHGAGAIGTAAVPTTKRWIERGGIIVTQTTFDLTGLASGGTANDVVGLAAGGAAYIGRNVVATNGVIFKMELSCLETPVTGDGDIDIVADTSAALIGDGAYTGAIKINGGTLVVGQTVQNLVPAVTDNFYFYIAAVGAGGGTYTAGMYVLTTYGHAVLA